MEPLSIRLVLPILLQLEYILVPRLAFRCLICLVGLSWHFEYVLGFVFQAGLGLVDQEAMVIDHLTIRILGLSCSKIR